MIAGRVTELWRYPVKSLLGERLEAAALTPDGVEGDRRLAIVDAGSGHVLSAKKLSMLLTARAETLNGTVTLTLPDGSRLGVDDPSTRQRLTAWLGRDVELERAPGGEQRAVIEGDQGVFRGRAGGFFDSSAVHILTTSTLETLNEFRPEGRFDARRFRPNVVLETVAPGFVEESWVGVRLRVGEAEIEITKPCSRCVMTTHAQEDLPVDRDILRTVRAGNDDHVGVYGIVRRPGVVKLGDEALLVG